MSCPAGSVVAAEVRGACLRMAPARRGDRIEAHRLVDDRADEGELLDLAPDRSRRHDAAHLVSACVSSVPGFAARSAAPRHSDVAVVSWPPTSSVIRWSASSSSPSMALPSSQRAATSSDKMSGRAASASGDSRAAAGDLAEEDRVDGADAVGDVLHRQARRALAVRARRHVARRARGEVAARAPESERSAHRPTGV